MPVHTSICRATSFASLAPLALILAACGGSPSGPAPSPKPTPTSSLSVSGKVLDTGGAPQAGMPVLLGDTPTITDAAGRFSGKVKAPYRLVVVVPSMKDPARREAMTYDGVSRADPTVVVQSRALRSASLSVDFSGSVGPGGTPKGVVALNGWTGATIDPGTPFARSWDWYGSPTLDTPLCFLRMGEFSAPKFTGFGFLSRITLKNAQPVSYGVTLSPVETANLSGSAAVPQGYHLSAVGGGFNCGHEGGPLVSQDTTGSASFSLPMPVLPIPLWVGANATKGDAFASVRRSGVTSDSSLALTVPTAPEFVGPADGTVGLTPAAEFSWLPFAGGLNTVRFVPTDPGGLAYTIASTGTSTHLPDLTALGFPPAKGTSYSAQVNSLAPVNSVDAWLSGEPFDYSSGYSFGQSDQRHFTTAP